MENTLVARGHKIRGLLREYIPADNATEAALLAQADVQGVTTPNFEQYGGATVTLATDGAGVEYIAFCARFLPTGTFGFYIINLKTMAQVPYTPFCTGRGSISNAGKWVAWTNKDYYRGQIAGFVPYPNVSADVAALAARVAQLEQNALIAQRTIGNLSQQLVEIQTALGNVASGNLAPQDRRALDILRNGLDKI